MILVTGASGFVGGALADVLAQGRRPVLSVARRMPDHGGGPEDSRCVAVDVLDRARLRAQCSDVRAIVHLAGVPPGVAPDRADHEVQAMRSLLDFAREREVERFVYLSATGAAEGATLPWLRAKGEAERGLRDSGVPFVILRAGILVGERSQWLNALAQAVRAHEVLRLPMLCHGTLRAIAVSDVAIALATALDHHVMRDRTLELGAGPPLTLARLLERVAQRIGRALEVRQGLFAGVRLARALSGMGAGGATLDGRQFEKWFSTTEAPDVAEYDRALPMDRVSLEDGLRDMPWGDPPPRPGQPLPVIQPSSGEPLFIPGPHLMDDAEQLPGYARSFGRVDPFGQQLPTDSPEADPEDAESGADSER